jgi:hypothetical protein
LFIATISIVGGGIYLRFVHGALMKRNKFLIKDEILTFLSLFALQVAHPKADKSFVTNSFEIVINLSM